MLGKTLKNRYNLEQILAQGEQGNLFLATDTSSGEMLAVKIFPPQVDFQGQGGLRYLQAMRRLQKLSHPNLLVPLDTEFADGCAFQVAPYMPGLSLEQTLAENPFSDEECRELLRQTALGLASLHGAGLTHGNLKPSNLLVFREEGQLQVVVCDPARPLLAPDDFPYGGPSTAPYRAPEEIPALDRTPDARSDLYALGMIGYLVATGNPPFGGITSRQIALAHLAGEPPRLQSPGETTPGRPSLETILKKLSEKEPSARYPSAEALLADLLPVGEAPPRPPEDAQPEVRPIPLLGREEESAALEASLARSLTGKGTLLVLAGQPGIGKGRLFENLVPRVIAGEGLVLRAPLPPSPWCAPFQAPLMLLQDLARQWETLPITRRRYLARRMATALGPNAGVLTALFPPAADLFDAPEPPPPLPQEREHYRTLHVLTEAFAALAEARHPLVVWIGRIQQADPDSVAWMETLLPRLADCPMLVVSGYTPARTAGRGAFQRWIQEGVKDPTVQWLELNPLDGKSARDFAGHYLAGHVSGGGMAGPALVEKVTDWVRARWDASPLALSSALGWLIEREVLRPTPEGPQAPDLWECNWEALENLSPPEELAGLLAARVLEAREEQRLLLGAASIFPRAFSLESLAGLIEHLPPEVVLEQVETAIRLGFLRRSNGAIRFCNEAVRDAFHEAVPEGRRSHHHRVLGALAESGPIELPLMQHHVTARHFLLGGDTTRFVRHGMAATDEARRHHAIRGAALGLQGLLPHLGNDVRLPQFLVALAECRLLNGQPDQALETLGKTEGLDLTDALRQEILRVGAAAETMRGEPMAAVPVLEQALELMGATLPGSQMGAALARLARGARRRYVEMRVAAGGPAPEAMDEGGHRIALLLEQTALALYEFDRERALLTDEKLLQFTASHRPAPVNIRALLRLGEAHGNPDDPYLTEAAELAAEGGFIHEEAERLTVVGRCRFNLFDLHGAREALFKAYETFGRLGDPVGKAEALRWVVEVERMQGPAGTLLDRSRRLTRLRGLLPTEAEGDWGQAVRTYCEALAGKRPCGEAAQELRILAEKAHQAEQPAEAAYFLFLCTEMLLGSGRDGDARNAMEAFPSGIGEGNDFWSMLLKNVRAETHLLQAEASPEDHEWHTAQAHKLMGELLAAGKAFPRLAVETARLQMMIHLSSGKPEAALEIAHQWETLLDGQTARISLGRMTFRLAEGLKSTQKSSWRSWAEKALSMFETTGAEPFSAAARDLLEQQPLPESPFPEIGEREEKVEDWPLSTSLETALLSRLEAVLRGESPSPKSLYRPLLRQFAELAGADYAVLLLPDATGQPQPVERWARIGEAGECNPWLVETVWKEQRAELVERFLLSPDEGTGSAGRESAQTAICVPLAAGDEVSGVAYLARGEGPRPFDRADLARLNQAAHQAGVVLALGSAITEARTGRKKWETEAREWELLMEWSARAGDGQNAEGILSSFLRQAGYPNGFQGALLYWAEEPTHSLTLGPWVADDVTQDALAPFLSLSLLGGETRAARAMEHALPQTTRPENTPHLPRETGLLQALRAVGGVWLPLAVGEKSVGAVLVFAQVEPPSRPEGWEERLTRPLRLIAPALHQARRADLLEAERDELAGRENRLLETTHRLQRFVPAHLRQAQPGPQVQGGTEIWSSITVGQIFDIGNMARLGARETIEQLNGYYGKVNEALALHEGHLERILGAQWVARYERGAENAIWGTLTMFQMLLAHQEQRSALGAPTLQTGLGIHIGSVIGGTVETEQRIEPVLVGEGFQVAAQLAEMCGTFRAGILVSEDAVQALENTAPFDLRSLGFFRIGPGGKRVGVSELYSTREPEIRESMRTKRGEWNAALRHYQLGEWKEGADLFRSYLDRLPQDRAARHFLRHCRQRASRDSERLPSP